MDFRPCLFAIALLGGCHQGRAEKKQADNYSDVKPGERISFFPIAGYNWQKDPDCYQPGTPPGNIDSGMFGPLNPSGLRWRPTRHFAGFMDVTFEGSGFRQAKRGDDPEAYKGKFRSELIIEDPHLSDNVNGYPSYAKIYWAEFTGREALCNEQRPDDASFDEPSSANVVVADHFEKVVRIR